jgi:hypothetical protein
MKLRDFSLVPFRKRIIYVYKCRSRVGTEYFIYNASTRKKISDNFDLLSSTISQLLKPTHVKKLKRCEVYRYVLYAKDIERLLNYIYESEICYATESITWCLNVHDVSRDILGVIDHYCENYVLSIEPYYLFIIESRYKRSIHLEVRLDVLRGRLTVYWTDDTKIREIEHNFNVRDVLELAKTIRYFVKNRMYDDVVTVISTLV